MAAANWDWCHREYTTSQKNDMSSANPLKYNPNSFRLLRSLGDGVYFLFPLILVLGLCLLGVSALDKQAEFEEQAELNLFPTNRVLEVEFTLEAVSYTHLTLPTNA